MHIFILAVNPTDSITHGFLPAAQRMALEVTLLTNMPAAHSAAYKGTSHSPSAVVECAVQDHREVIAACSRLPKPDAVFSNSDHLQMQTALTAEWFGLPGKCWQSALLAKNKFLMRKQLRTAGFDSVHSVEVSAQTFDAEHAADISFPAVLKPREGVASEDVFLVRDHIDLQNRCRDTFVKRPDDTFVVEQYIPGELHTLETLGDGKQLHVIGSFATTVSPLPYFTETRLEWDVELSKSLRDEVLDQLVALDIGFGACHTEFVADGDRARIIEVNDRVIGDNGDFLLAEITQSPLFESILKVYLGEPATSVSRHTESHGITEPVIAKVSGTLTTAPDALDVHHNDVHLTYLPQRSIGDDIKIQHSNRDYLGIISAVGSDPIRTQAAIDVFKSAHQWDITL